VTDKLDSDTSYWHVRTHNSQTHVPLFHHLVVWGLVCFLRLPTHFTAVKTTWRSWWSS